MSRQSVIDKSSPMIGRNIYSQSLRQYAIEPYSDGKYYSDCSSMCSAAYMTAGYNVGWNNTYSFCDHKDFYTVPCAQSGQHLIKPENVLKVADLIIWPGHMSMVHHIEGETIYIQDHGSGNPKLRTLYDCEKYHSGNIVIRRYKVFDLEESISTAPKKEEAVEAIPIPEAKSIVTNKTKLYKVHAGAFSSKENADNNAAKLKSLNIDSFRIMRGNLYANQCGAYKTQEAASEQADLIRALGFDAYVWKE